MMKFVKCDGKAVRQILACVAVAIALRFVGPATAAETVTMLPISAPIEASFRLRDGIGEANPFDYTAADVQVTLTGPEKTSARRPAFFDGDGLWRVRYSPRAAGHYSLAGVTLNGHPAAIAALMPKEGWTVNVATARRAGSFVRRDQNDFARFILDNGAAYYPVGHNIAWTGGRDSDYPIQFARMHAAGENWSRIWMNHWDGKNLDWVPGEKIVLGELSLKVARKWDGIVAAADANNIHFQMTLQHHGPYSSYTDSNWRDNPWNAANPGGFLSTPTDFFISERARALTRAKYRYIVARWGYSPAIMAWELFNEVQWTDAIHDKRYDIVDAWHKEMADFLRAQDLDHHLITTSSDTAIPGLFEAVDYVQPHTYPPDVVAAVQSAKPSEWRKPIFYGEIGGSGDLGADRGGTLHAILWASLMSESSGAAQYWAWDTVEKNNLYGQFAPFTAFLKMTGLPELSSRMRTVTGIEVTTPDRGQVSFGPGGGWGQAPKTVFAITPSGEVDGVAQMPAFLQGTNNHALFPQADFVVDTTAPAAITVAFRQVSKNGAHPHLRIDGAVVAERDYPAAASDTRLSGESGTLTAPVPVGRHTIRLENSGTDWAVIQRVSLAPFGPTLRVLAKAGANAAVLWASRNSPAGGSRSSAGTITLPATISGLSAGRYRVLWWDSGTGKPISESVMRISAGKPLTLALPPIEQDAAAFIKRIP